VTGDRGSLAAPGVLIDRVLRAFPVQHAAVLLEVCEELASDLWAVPKAISDMSDLEQLEAWYQAVDVLGTFGKLAEVLHNGALLLAVTDAKERANEEMNRAVWRRIRSEGAALHPSEEHRLTELLSRSDALNNAVAAVEDDGEMVEQIKAQTLEVLRPLRGEAAEAFARYRLEIGLED
jgi:hypothetical protein